MTTKLLAVDDSKTMRQVLEITFRGDEFQTTLAGSAEQALSAVRAQPPQVAVVDAHLGDSSGYDLCRSIKEISPTTRVLILSSKQRPYDENKGAAAGADGHFDKPFDSTKMLARVGEEVEKGAAQAPSAAAQSSAGPRAADQPGSAGPAPAMSAKPAGTSNAARPAPQQPARPAPAEPAPAEPAPVRPPASAPAQATPASPAGSSSAARPAPAAAPPAREPATSAPSVGARRPQAPPPRTSAAPPQTSLNVPEKPDQPAARGQAATQAATAAAVSSAGLEGKLEGLGLSNEQIQSVVALSREVVEQVVWEVVPTLAETLIKEEIARLTAE